MMIFKSFFIFSPLLSLYNLAFVEELTISLSFFRKFLSLRISLWHRDIRRIIVYALLIFVNRLATDMMSHFWVFSESWRGLHSIFLRIPQVFSPL